VKTCEKVMWKLNLVKRCWISYTPTIFPTKFIYKIIKAQHFSICFFHINMYSQENYMKGNLWFWLVFALLVLKQSSTLFAYDFDFHICPISNKKFKLLCEDLKVLWNFVKKGKKNSYRVQYMLKKIRKFIRSLYYSVEHYGVNQIFESMYN